MAKFEEMKMEKNGRLKLALIFGHHDPDLRNFLEERGYPPEFQDQQFKRLQHLKTCKDIRSFMLRVLSGPAQGAVIEHTKASAKWIESKSDLPYPPHYALERLENLDSKTLPDYLGELERVVDDLYRSAISSLPSRPSLISEMAHNIIYENKVTEAQEFKEVRAGHRENLEHLLFKYIEKGDEEALEVLTYALRKRPEEEDASFAADLYFKIFKDCLERLKHNPHLIASLVNLMYEDLYRRVPELNRGEPLAGRHSFSLIIEGLKEADIADPVSHSDFTLENPGQPREYCHFGYELKLQGNKRRAIAIPAEFAPSSWNEHRLVDPRRSEAFKVFAKKLAEKLQVIDQADREAEIAKYRKELKNDRRYALDFARLKISEIPSPEGYQVWLHYFYDQDLPPGHIGIELILENEKTGQSLSVVYLMDQELNFVIPNSILEGQKSGRPYHPVKPEISGGLDLSSSKRIPGSYPSAEYMYVREGGRLYEWADSTSHELLRYYFAKYAHCLLVRKRDEEGQEIISQSSAINPQPPDFNLSLDEYFSEVTIPREDNKENEGVQAGKRELVMIFHMVSGFRRILRKGEKPSDSAIALAKKAGVNLQDENGNYTHTFVRTHPRGSVIGKESHDPKKGSRKPKK